MKYVIDTSKPPIFPPNREFKYTFLRTLLGLGPVETEESKKNTLEHAEYLKNYNLRLLLEKVT